MDDTTGLLTILCQHVFHCACLSKWKDSSCPVCRYTQSSRPSATAGGGSGGGGEDEEEEASCITCGATQNLWICLICGNVGCGRYDDAHAFEHYKATSHCYAMDIQSQRVWDYASDGYVHRLIQNKSDGKLVELPSSNNYSPYYPDGGGGGGGGGELIPSAKLEDIGMEYTYLLTSQLESQRQYFEQKIAQAADKASSAAAAAERATAEAEAAVASLRSIQEKHDRLTLDVVPGLEKARLRAEAKALKFAETARRMEKEWEEEKRVGEGLLERVQFLDKENAERTADVDDLREQVRDLMFFLQARDKMEDCSDDVQEGTVTVAEAPPAPPSKKKKGKGKAKR